MAPDIRLAVVLFGSFTLWLPALTAFLAGDLGAGEVAGRYAASLAGTLLAVTVLSAVVRGYRTEPDEVATTPDGRAERRSEDSVTSPGGPPGDPGEPDLTMPEVEAPAR